MIQITPNFFEFHTCHTQQQIVEDLVEPNIKVKNGEEFYRGAGSSDVVHGVKTPRLIEILRTQDHRAVVFFDVFIKNGLLYIIMPINSFESDNFEVFTEGCALKLKKNTESLEHQPCRVKIYNFPFNQQKEYKVFIRHENCFKEFLIKPVEKETPKKLCLTTLFKTDYKLNKIFYDYYKNEGVEHFYMYYNGKINDEIKKYYNKPDITLIEWDFDYWSAFGKLSEHHAQPAQINHALYRFGKQNTDYMIFCDLDEYLYNKDYRLIDLVQDDSVDTYGFCNVWASTLDKKVPDKFPDKFRMMHSYYKFPCRSKCIHKTSSIDLAWAHDAALPECGRKIHTDSMMYHFHSWGGGNIEEY